MHPLIWLALSTLCSVVVVGWKWAFINCLVSCVGFTFWRVCWFRARAITSFLSRGRFVLQTLPNGSLANIFIVFRKLSVTVGAPKISCRRRDMTQGVLELEVPFATISMTTPVDSRGPAVSTTTPRRELLPFFIVPTFIVRTMNWIVPLVRLRIGRVEVFTQHPCISAATPPIVIFGLLLDGTAVPAIDARVLSFPPGSGASSASITDPAFGVNVTISIGGVVFDQVNVPPALTRTVLATLLSTGSSREEIGANMCGTCGATVLQCVARFQVLSLSQCAQISNFKHTVDSVTPPAASQRPRNALSFYARTVHRIFGLSERDAAQRACYCTHFDVSVLGVITSSESLHSQQLFAPGLRADLNLEPAWKSRPGNRGRRDGINSESFIQQAFAEYVIALIALLEAHVSETSQVTHSNVDSNGAVTSMSLLLAIPPPRVSVTIHPMLTSVNINFAVYEHDASVLHRAAPSLLATEMLSTVSLSCCAQLGAPSWKRYVPAGSLNGGALSESADLASARIIIEFTQTKLCGSVSAEALATADAEMEFTAESIVIRGDTNLCATTSGSASERQRAHLTCLVTPRVCVSKPAFRLFFSQPQWLVPFLSKSICGPPAQISPFRIISLRDQEPSQSVSIPVTIVFNPRLTIVELSSSIQCGSLGTAFEAGQFVFGSDITTSDPFPNRPDENHDSAICISISLSIQKTSPETSRLHLCIGDARGGRRGDSLPQLLQQLLTPRRGDAFESRDADSAPATKASIARLAMESHRIGVWLFHSRSESASVVFQALPATVLPVVGEHYPTMSDSQSSSRVISSAQVVWFGSVGATFDVSARRRIFSSTATCACDPPLSLRAEVDFRTPKIILNVLWMKVVIRFVEECGSSSIPSLQAGQSLGLRNLSPPPAVQKTRANRMLRGAQQIASATDDAAIDIDGVPLFFAVCIRHASVELQAGELLAAVRLEQPEVPVACGSHGSVLPRDRSNSNVDNCHQSAESSGECASGPKRSASLLCTAAKIAFTMNVDVGTAFGGVSRTMSVQRLPRASLSVGEFVVIVAPTQIISLPLLSCVSTSLDCAVQLLRISSWRWRWTSGSGACKEGVYVATSSVGISGTAVVSEAGFIRVNWSPAAHLAVTQVVLQLSMAMRDFHEVLRRRYVSMSAEPTGVRHAAASPPSLAPTLERGQSSRIDVQKAQPSALSVTLSMSSMVATTSLSARTVASWCIGRLSGRASRLIKPAGMTPASNNTLFEADVEGIAVHTHGFPRPLLTSRAVSIRGSVVGPAVLPLVNGNSNGTLFSFVLSLSGAHVFLQRQCVTGDLFQDLKDAQKFVRKCTTALRQLSQPLAMSGRTGTADEASLESYPARFRVQVLISLGDTIVEWQEIDGARYAMQKLIRRHVRDRVKRIRDSARHVMSATIPHDESSPNMLPCQSSSTTSPPPVGIMAAKLFSVEFCFDSSMHSQSQLKTRISSLDSCECTRQSGAEFASSDSECCACANAMENGVRDVLGCDISVKVAEFVLGVREGRVCLASQNAARPRHHRLPEQSLLDLASRLEFIMLEQSVDHRVRTLQSGRNCLFSKRGVSASDLMVPLVASLLRKLPIATAVFFLRPLLFLANGGLHGEVISADLVPPTHELRQYSVTISLPACRVQPHYAIPVRFCRIKNVPLTEAPVVLQSCSAPFSRQVDRDTLPNAACPCRGSLFPTIVASGVRAVSPSKLYHDVALSFTGLRVHYGPAREPDLSAFATAAARIVPMTAAHPFTDMLVHAWQCSWPTDGLDVATPLTMSVVASSSSQSVNDAARAPQSHAAPQEISGFLAPLLRVPKPPPLKWWDRLRYFLHGVATVRVTDFALLVTAPVPIPVLPQSVASRSTGAADSVSYVPDLETRRGFHVSADTLDIAFPRPASVEVCTAGLALRPVSYSEPSVWVPRALLFNPPSLSGHPSTLAYPLLSFPAVAIAVALQWETRGTRLSSPHTLSPFDHHLQLPRVLAATREMHRSEISVSAEHVAPGARQDEYASFRSIAVHSHVIVRVSSDLDAVLQTIPSVARIKTRPTSPAFAAARELNAVRYHRHALWARVLLSTLIRVPAVKSREAGVTSIQSAELNDDAMSFCSVDTDEDGSSAADCNNQLLRLVTPPGPGVSSSPPPAATPVIAIEWSSFPSIVLSYAAITDSFPCPPLSSSELGYDCVAPAVTSVPSSLAAALSSLILDVEIALPSQSRLLDVCRYADVQSFLMRFRRVPSWKQWHACPEGIDAARVPPRQAPAEAGHATAQACRDGSVASACPPQTDSVVVALWSHANPESRGILIRASNLRLSWVVQRKSHVSVPQLLRGIPHGCEVSLSSFSLAFPRLLSEALQSHRQSIHRLCAEEKRCASNNIVEARGVFVFSYSPHPLSMVSPHRCFGSATLVAYGTSEIASALRRRRNRGLDSASRTTPTAPCDVLDGEGGCGATGAACDASPWRCSLPLTVHEAAQMAIVDPTAFRAGLASAAAHIAAHPIIAQTKDSTGGGVHHRGRAGTDDALFGDGTRSHTMTPALASSPDFRAQSSDAPTRNSVVEAPSIELWDAQIRWSLASRDAFLAWIDEINEGLDRRHAVSWRPFGDQAAQRVSQAAIAQKDGSAASPAPTPVLNVVRHRAAVLTSHALACLCRSLTADVRHALDQDMCAHSPPATQAVCAFPFAFLMMQCADFSRSLRDLSCCFVQHALCYALFAGAARLLRINPPPVVPAAIYPAVLLPILRSAFPAHARSGNQPSAVSPTSAVVPTLRVAFIRPQLAVVDTSTGACIILAGSSASFVMAKAPSSEVGYHTLTLALKSQDETVSAVEPTTGPRNDGATETGFSFGTVGIALSSAATSGSVADAVDTSPQGTGSSIATGLRLLRRFHLCFREISVFVDYRRVTAGTALVWPLEVDADYSDRTSPVALAKCRARWLHGFVSARAAARTTSEKEDSDTVGATMQRCRDLAQLLGFAAFDNDGSKSSRAAKFLQIVAVRTEIHWLNSLYALPMLLPGAVTAPPAATLPSQGASSAYTHRVAIANEAIELLENTFSLPSLHVVVLPHQFRSFFSAVRNVFLAGSSDNAAAMAERFACVRRVSSPLPWYLNYAIGVGLQTTQSVCPPPLLALSSTFAIPDCSTHVDVSGGGSDLSLSKPLQSTSAPNTNASIAQHFVEADTRKTFAALSAQVQNHACTGLTLALPALTELFSEARAGASVSTGDLEMWLAAASIAHTQSSYDVVVDVSRDHDACGSAGKAIDLQAADESVPQAFDGSVGAAAEVVRPLLRKYEERLLRARLQDRMEKLLLLGASQSTASVATSLDAPSPPVSAVASADTKVDSQLTPAAVVSSAAVSAPEAHGRAQSSWPVNSSGSLSTTRSGAVVLAPPPPPHPTPPARSAELKSPLLLLRSPALVSPISSMISRRYGGKTAKFRAEGDEAMPPQQGADVLTTPARARVRSASKGTSAPHLIPAAHADASSSGPTPLMTIFRKPDGGYDVVLSPPQAAARLKYRHDGITGVSHALFAEDYGTQVAPSGATGEVALPPKSVTAWESLSAALLFLQQTQPALLRAGADSPFELTSAHVMRAMLVPAAPWLQPGAAGSLPAPRPRRIRALEYGIAAATLEMCAPAAVFMPSLGRVGLKAAAAAAAAAVDASAAAEGAGGRLEGAGGGGGPARAWCGRLEGPPRLRWLAPDGAALCSAHMSTKGRRCIMQVELAALRGAHTATLDGGTRAEYGLGAAVVQETLGAAQMPRATHVSSASSAGGVSVGAATGAQPSGSGIVAAPVYVVDAYVPPQAVSRRPVFSATTVGRDVTPMDKLVYVTTVSRAPLLPFGGGSAEPHGDGKATLGMFGPLSELDSAVAGLSDDMRTRIDDCAIRSLRVPVFDHVEVSVYPGAEHTMDVDVSRATAEFCSAFFFLGARGRKRAHAGKAKASAPAAVSRQNSSIGIRGVDDSNANMSSGSDYSESDDASSSSSELSAAGGGDKEASDSDGSNRPGGVHFSGVPDARELKLQTGKSVPTDDIQSTIRRGISFGTLSAVSEKLGRMSRDSNNAGDSQGRASPLPGPAAASLGAEPKVSRSSKLKALGRRLVPLRLRSRQKPAEPASGANINAAGGATVSTATVLPQRNTAARSAFNSLLRRRAATGGSARVVEELDGRMIELPPSPSLSSASSGSDAPSSTDSESVGIRRNDSAGGGSQPPDFAVGSMEASDRDSLNENSEDDAALQNLPPIIASRYFQRSVQSELPQAGFRNASGARLAQRQRRATSHDAAYRNIADRTNGSSSEESMGGKAAPSTSWDPFRDEMPAAKGLSRSYNASALAVAAAADDLGDSASVIADYMRDEETRQEELVVGTPRRGAVADMPASATAALKIKQRQSSSEMFLGIAPPPGPERLAHAVTDAATSTLNRISGGIVRGVLGSAAAPLPAEDGEYWQRFHDAADNPQSSTLTLSKRMSLSLGLAWLRSSDSQAVPSPSHALNSPNIAGLLPSATPRADRALDVASRTVKSPLARLFQTPTAAPAPVSDWVSFDEPNSLLAHAQVVAGPLEPPNPRGKLLLVAGAAAEALSIARDDSTTVVRTVGTTTAPAGASVSTPVKAPTSGMAATGKKTGGAVSRRLRGFLTGMFTRRRSVAGTESGTAVSRADDAERRTAVPRSSSGRTLAAPEISQQGPSSAASIPIPPAPSLAPPLPPQQAAAVAAAATVTATAASAGAARPDCPHLFVPYVRSSARPTRCAGCGEAITGFRVRLCKCTLCGLRTHRGECAEAVLLLLAENSEAQTTLAAALNSGRTDALGFTASSIAATAAVSKVTPEVLNAAVVGKSSRRAADTLERSSQRRSSRRRAAAAAAEHAVSMTAEAVIPRPEQQVPVSSSAQYDNTAVGSVSAASVPEHHRDRDSFVDDINRLFGMDAISVGGAVGTRSTLIAPPSEGATASTRIAPLPVAPASGPAALALVPSHSLSSAAPSEAAADAAILMKALLRSHAMHSRACVADAYTYVVEDDDDGGIGFLPFFRVEGRAVVDAPTPPPLLPSAVSSAKDIAAAVPSDTAATGVLLQSPPLLPPVSAAALAKKGGGRSGFARLLRSPKVVVPMHNPSPATAASAQVAEEVTAAPVTGDAPVATPMLYAAAPPNPAVDARAVPQTGEPTTAGSAPAASGSSSGGGGGALMPPYVYFRYVRVGALSLSLTLSGYYGLRVNGLEAVLKPVVFHTSLLTWDALLERLRRHVRGAVWAIIPRLVGRAVGAAAVSRLEAGLESVAAFALRATGRGARGRKAPAAGGGTSAASTLTAAGGGGGGLPDAGFYFLSPGLAHLLSFADGHRDRLWAAMHAGGNAALDIADIVPAATPAASVRLAAMPGLRDLLLLYTSSSPSSASQAAAAAGAGQHPPPLSGQQQQQQRDLAWVPQAEGGGRAARGEMQSHLPPPPPVLHCPQHASPADVLHAYSASAALRATADGAAASVASTSATAAVGPLVAANVARGSIFASTGGRSNSDVSAALQPPMIPLTASTGPISGGADRISRTVSTHGSSLGDCHERSIYANEEDADAFSGVADDEEDDEGVSLPDDSMVPTSHADDLLPRNGAASAVSTAGADAALLLRGGVSAAGLPHPRQHMQLTEWLAAPAQQQASLMRPPRQPPQAPAPGDYHDGRLGARGGAGGGPIARIRAAFVAQRRGSNAAPTPASRRYSHKET